MESQLIARTQKRIKFWSEQLSSIQNIPLKNTAAKLISELKTIIFLNYSTGNANNITDNTSKIISLINEIEQLFEDTRLFVVKKS